MSKPAAPNVYTIAPGLDFAAVLVRAVLDGGLDLAPLRDNPLGLADLVIYVPTRRIQSRLEAEFARALAPRPVMLPSIRTLREPGRPLEEAIAADDPVLATASRRIMTPAERRYRLLPMVTEWLAAVEARRAHGGAVSTPSSRAAFLAEAMRLAGALGGLIDEMAIEGQALSRLEHVAPERFDPAQHDEYWWMTRDFLRLAALRWPAMLDQLEAEDEAVARLRRIGDEAARLEVAPPAHPVIIAGSTGSVRATVALMRAVASLPQGAVVLPGLDLGLDEESWSLIATNDAALIRAKNIGYATRFAHPQAVLKRSLVDLGIPRMAVRPLGEPSPAEAGRIDVLSQAFIPAETSDLWAARRARTDFQTALSGFRVVVARDERQEAEAIALLMRETLDQPDRTVALVTPDRRLARRVSIALQRWGITAEDSAGRSLADSRAGLLLRLLLAAIEARDGASLLALLRHPLVRLGETADQLAALRDGMELRVWRGRHATLDPRQQNRALAALRRHDRPGGAAARVPAECLARLPAFAARLDALLDQLAGPDGGDASLAELADRLSAQLLALTEDETGEALLLLEPEWPHLADLFDEMRAHAGDIAAPAQAMQPIIEAMLKERSVPQRSAAHPRAAILGLIEARLIAPDRLILAGLTEGTLPPAAESDPFLNRAMREAVGLQPPERRIGQSAHDVTLFAAHPDVILTHAERSGGQPGIASRFLRRMAAFAGEKAWEVAVKEGEKVLALTALIDPTDGPPKPCARPDIVPESVPRVPSRLRVTELETLRRDPYALYARTVLRLEPLEPVDALLDGRDLGTLLHQVIERFNQGEAAPDIETAMTRLRDIGADVFRPLAVDQELHFFWWRRFLAILPDLAALDIDTRREGWSILSECNAALPLRLKTGDVVEIRGRIDRIERGAGGVRILDFKSGATPGPGQVAAFLAPQLPVSAALVERGGVTDLPKGTGIEAIGYVPINGRKPTKPKFITVKDRSLADIIAADWALLESDLDALAAGVKGWRSRVAPLKTTQSGDYDHLARIREWTILPADGEADVDTPEQGDDE